MDADEQGVGKRRIFRADNGKPLVQNREQESLGQHVHDQRAQFLDFEFLDRVDDGIVCVRKFRQRYGDKREIEFLCPLLYRLAHLHPKRVAGADSKADADRICIHGLVFLRCQHTTVQIDAAISECRQSRS